MKFRAQKYLSTANVLAATPLLTPELRTETFNRVTGKVISDQAGTLNLQHSDDGVIWHTLTTASITANTPAKFDEILYCAFFRVSYTTAVNTTSFSLSYYGNSF